MESGIQLIEITPFLTQAATAVGDMVTSAAPAIIPAILAIWGANAGLKLVRKFLSKVG